MVNCPECSAENPEIAKFCKECGNEIKESIIESHGNSELNDNDSTIKNFDINPKAAKYNYLMDVDNGEYAIDYFNNMGLDGRLDRTLIISDRRILAIKEYKFEIIPFNDIDYMKTERSVIQHYLDLYLKDGSKRFIGGSKKKREKIESIINHFMHDAPDLINFPDEKVLYQISYDGFNKLYAEFIKLDKNSSGNAHVNILVTNKRFFLYIIQQHDLLKSFWDAGATKTSWKFGRPRLSFINIKTEDITKIEIGKWGINIYSEEMLIIPSFPLQYIPLIDTITLQQEEYECSVCGKIHTGILSPPLKSWPELVALMCKNCQEIFCDEHAKPGFFSSAKCPVCGYKIHKTENTDKIYKYLYQVSFSNNILNMAIFPRSEYEKDNISFASNKKYVRENIIPALLKANPNIEIENV